MPANTSPLGEQEIQQFRRLGYLVVPGFITDEQARRVEADVDRYAVEQPKFDGRNVAQYDALCELIVHPQTLAIVDQLTGEHGFTFHHLHAALHPPGMPGIGWHHDYEQVPQTNRAHTQVHVLHYLNGLDGSIGDFVLLPKSHRAVMRRDAFFYFGTESLPGEVVLDSLPRGSTLFCHSALVHARRSKPGGGERSRYFIDIAFMELFGDVAGAQWPSYGREGWQDMLARLDAKLHQADRPQLFDASRFFDIADANARLAGLQGSMALLLPEPDPALRPVSGRIPIV